MTQSFKNIEIIVVNDGSPDKSSEIIKSLQQSDSRIILLEKQNGGVSSARNYGLNYASGEYILFVDGDDFVDKRYAEYFLSLISYQNADVAFSYNYTDGRKTFSQSINDEVPSIVDSDTAIEELYLNKTGVAVWNKIYKKSFLNNNSLCFNENFWFAEGMTFNIEAFKSASVIICGHKCLYNQTINPDSAVRKFNIDSWYCGIKAMEYQKQIINKSNKRIINAWNYHRREYNYSILKGIIKSNSTDQFSKEMKQCINNLHRNIRYPLIVNIGNKAKLKCLCISLAPILIAKRDIYKESREWLTTS